MYIHHGEIYFDKSHVQIIRKEPIYVQKRYRAVVAVLSKISNEKQVKAARSIGVSKRQFHRILKRFREEGIPGLRHRSRRPKNSPNKTPDWLEEIVVKVREETGLVFKGGTSLYKLHGLNRFSSDLDFSGKINEPTARKIAQYITDFGYDTEVLTKTVKSGILITFVTQGFLFQGRPESLARVQMDVNDVKVELDPVWPQFFSLYPDIPSYKLQAMALEEVAAEKVRALLVRTKARDAYDIWFILSKDVTIDSALVRKKLRSYNLELNKGTLQRALKACEDVWRRELKPLMIEVPNYTEVKRSIEDAMKI